MPIGYSENAFTGYMAQAAYSIGWYAIVDYVDRPENENKRIYRPDLYLAIKKEQELSIVFEVKKEWISLDLTASRLSPEVIAAVSYFAANVPQCILSDKAN